MNRNYESFRSNVVYAMRNSGLEIGAIYYILKDILNEAEHAFSSTVQQEIEAERNAMMEAESHAENNSDNKDDNNTEVEDVDI